MIAWDKWDIHQDHAEEEWSMSTNKASVIQQVSVILPTNAMISFPKNFTWEMLTSDSIPNLELHYYFLNCCTKFILSHNFCYFILFFTYIAELIIVYVVV